MTRWPIRISVATFALLAAGPVAAQQAALGEGSPAGAEEYARLTLQYATLPLSPDEVRAIGQSELDRVLADFDAVIAEIGFEGTTGEFFEHVRTDDSLHYPDTDEGCATYQADAQRAVAAVEARLAELVEPPTTLTALDVAAMPPETPREVVAMYAAPGMRISAADSEPLERGTVLLNLSDCAAPKLRLPALAYHEGVPGHHLQAAFALAAGLRSSPEPAGYFEGWALYAERLPCELGLCEDPYARISLLIGEGTRAARVLVDVGVHVDGWTEGDAAAFLLANTSLSELQAQLEVDRILARPARLSAYTIGKIEIAELRARAEEVLGDDFDLRAFHREVLADGPMALPDLEAKIDRWIAEAAAAP